MDINHAIDDMTKISASMFWKGFFGIYHGSISVKLEKNKFVINKEDALFDALKPEDVILLYDNKRDYRWNDVSHDSDVHLNIYKNLPDARAVCYAMPPFTTAYSLNHDFIIPKDYFGYKFSEKIKVHDPRQFDDWMDRAPHEIYRHMMERKTNICVIKGHGIYAYARNCYDMAKAISIIENSCRILHYEKMLLTNF